MPNLGEGNTPRTKHVADPLCLSINREWPLVESAAKGCSKSLATPIVYWGYIGIMENKMETTVKVYFGLSNLRFLFESLL